MKRTAVAFLFASSILSWTSCQSAQAIDDLFPDSLFPPDKQSKPLDLFDEDQNTPTIKSSKPKADPAAAKAAQKAQLDREDEQMRQQIQKVASWLQEFSMRNQQRFPGTYGSSNTIARASEVQLTELVGPNPYVNTDSVDGIGASELNGLAPGLTYNYSSNGMPIGGSPLANSEWTSELTADNAHRIQLQMDQSATPGSVDLMRNSPPSTMQLEPGTIFAAGNGQGFLYVWGAGADGKPVKDYNGKPYIMMANTADNVNDVGQEAGY